MHEASDKIIYKGYIFEAMKVNDSIEEYARTVIRRLHDKNYSEYEGHIEPSKTPHKPNSEFNNKLYKIKTIMSTNSPNISAEYRTRHAKSDKNDIVERVITIYFNKDVLENSTDNDYYFIIYSQLIHELLHAIDPKSIDAKIMNSLPKYQDGSKDIADYMEQPQEREVLISSAAHRIIQTVIRTVIAAEKEKGRETPQRTRYFMENFIKTGEIMKYANGFINNEKNMKEFLKLCYYYIGQEMKNIYGKQ